MALAIINSIFSGFLFVIWSKKNVINFLIKFLFLGLFIANVVALVKV